MTTAKKISPVRLARVAQGVSQFQLAQTVGVSENRISRLETGRQPADEELRRKIADVLNIPTYEVA